MLTYLIWAIDYWVIAETCGYPVCSSTQLLSKSSVGWIACLVSLSTREEVCTYLLICCLLNLRSLWSCLHPVTCSFGSSSWHIASYVHSLCLSPCHTYLGVPKGVTVLEFTPPKPEEQQREPPQEEGAEEEDLPECPDHRPSTYIEGKPGAL